MKFDYVKDHVCEWRNCSSSKLAPAAGALGKHVIYNVAVDYFL